MDAERGERNLTDAVAHSEGFDTVSSDGRRRGGDQIIPRPAIWRAENWAPWLQPVSSAPSSAEIAARFAAAERPSAPLTPAFRGARLSAVLLLLADGPDGAEVLLTKRSLHLRNHRGEVSFPGGRIDPGETSLQAALREANEEVGLDPSSVTAIGELTHLDTVVSRSYIVPHIGVVAERHDLVPTSSEVDRVWWTPLRELLDEPTYHREIWGAPPTDRTLHFFDLDDETVWGATAHVLVDLLTRVSDPFN